MKRFYIALGLSLLFHLIQYAVVNLAPLSDIFQKKNETPIDIIETQQTNSAKIKEKQIVPVPKVKSVINQDPAKFFTEETQRVEKETATKNLGVTKNQTQKQQIKNTTQKQKESSDEPEFAKVIRQSTEASSPSALEFALPKDIAEGSATNLNTDAHIYASFYNRVTELFYIRWAQRLDSIWDRLPDEIKKNLSGRVWNTDIEVWLKSDGEYYKSIIMKPSGFQNFDNAAVFAFQNAKFFPNPPRAKVESDGFVRLRYRIAVHVR